MTHTCQTRNYSLPISMKSYFFLSAASVRGAGVSEGRVRLSYFSAIQVPREPISHEEAVMIGQLGITLRARKLPAARSLPGLGHTNTREDGGGTCRPCIERAPPLSAR